MNNKDYKPVSNYMALTIKKENRLTVKKVSKKVARVVAKIVLYLTLLTFANILT